MEFKGGLCQKHHPPPPSSAVRKKEEPRVLSWASICISKVLSFHPGWKREAIPLITWQDHHVGVRLTAAEPQRLCAAAAHVHELSDGKLTPVSPSESTFYLWVYFTLRFIGKTPASTNQRWLLIFWGREAHFPVCHTCPGQSKCMYLVHIMTPPPLWTDKTSVWSLCTKSNSTCSRLLISH